MHKVHVLSKFQKNPYPDALVIDTTSSSGDFSGLSPFLLNAERYGAKNFENLWQFSKVYPEHTEEIYTQLGIKYTILNEWFKWSQAGYNNPRAIRYPMGKGRKPLFSFWKGEKLDYVPARKKIYIPIYAELVQSTDSFKRLQLLHGTSDIALRDYDGYDYETLNMSLREVANNSQRKCGHAFVLKALLLDQLDDMLCCGHCSDSSDGHCENCSIHGGKIAST